MGTGGLGVVGMKELVCFQGRKDNSVSLGVGALSSSRVGAMGRENASSFQGGKRINLI